MSVTEKMLTAYRQANAWVEDNYGHGSAEIVGISVHVESRGDGRVTSVVRVRVLNADGTKVTHEARKER